MKSLLILVLSMLICGTTFAQTSSKNQLQLLEKEILEAKTDLLAVELITKHYQLRDEIYDYKVDLLNEMDETLSEIDKSRNLKAVLQKDKTIKNLQIDTKTARKEKVRYLRQHYPSSFRKFHNGSVVKKGQTVSLRN